MKLNQVLPEIKSLSLEEAKAKLHLTESKNIQLVDVRQPEEYSQSHLPGSMLIPVSELTEGTVKLDNLLPIVLYCKTGVRSLAAARWLNSNGYQDVSIINGGIEAWTGQTAFGHFNLNLNLLNQDATFPDAITMAYAMEEGMRQFYIRLARETSDQLYKDIFREMAAYETEHKKELSGSHFVELGDNPLQKALHEFGGQLTEGGSILNDALIRSLSNPNSYHEIFALALALETQAMDFYYRLGVKADKKETKKFFFEMADAEKKHVFHISRKMDNYLNGTNS